MRSHMSFFSRALSFSSSLPLVITPTLYLSLTFTLSIFLSILDVIGTYFTTSQLLTYAHLYAYIEMFNIRKKSYLKNYEMVVQKALNTRFITRLTFFDVLYGKHFRWVVHCMTVAPLSANFVDSPIIGGSVAEIRRTLKKILCWHGHTKFGRRIRSLQQFVVQ